MEKTPDQPNLIIAITIIIFVIVIAFGYLLYRNNQKIVSPIINNKNIPTLEKSQSTPTAEPSVTLKPSIQKSPTPAPSSTDIPQDISTTPETTPEP